MILILDTKEDRYRIMSQEEPTVRDLAACRVILDSAVLDIIDNHISHNKKLVPFNK